MDHGSIAQDKESLLKAMPEVHGYVGTFRSINKRWDGAITAGMIETGRMEAEAGKLFGPLIQDMGSTKDKYSEIQSRLVEAILYEMAKKVVFEITDAAKFAINILKRNLFERTADVGYLATDEEIVKFLKLLLEENDPGVVHERTEFIRARLADYRHEYTVYEEIIILDTEGNVRANLAPENRVSFSRDPLLEKTLRIDLHDGQDSDKYVETFRHSDLRPDHGNTLIYSQKIEDPENRAPLGTLCLCFAFADEMERIFKDLRQGNSHMIVAILDANGTIISSNNTELLPLEARVSVNLEADFRFLTFKGKAYLVSTVATDGYQGFYGLTWYGLAMIEADAAFKQNEAERLLEKAILQKLQSFSGELLSIKNESDDLLADMKLDSINGQVKAAKFAADGFVEVLRFVDWIGDEIDKIFSSAIENLQRTVVRSLFNDVQFRAFQGNNIADRNLYERANDVCWWALTPQFRQLLTKHADQGLDEEERGLLTVNLQYINDLYTPYLRLLLADTNGTVLAASNPPEDLEERFVQDDLPKGQEFVGLQLDHGLVRKALELKTNKDYCVSGFEPTSLYGGRPTYVYSTAVRSPQNEARAVGVIQIVFDAEPQFLAMLLDALPWDENKDVLRGSFAVFADRRKSIISSTHPAYPSGGKLNLSDTFFQHKNGERESTIVELDEKSYAIGLQVSQGYREYKSGDGYVNDVLCLVFVEI